MIDFFEIRENKTPQIVERVEFIETVEAEEVLNINAFKWEIEESKIFDISGTQIKEFKQIRRNDTKETLNICKNSYTPTSNEVLSETVYKISQLTGFEIVGFQEFKNGGIVLGQLKNEGFNIGGNTYNSYMIVGNSHNYQTSFFIGEHNTMIRCHNQFAAVKQGLKAYHTTTNERQIKNIIDFYKNYSLLQNQTIETLKKLEMTKISFSQKRDFILNMLEIKQNTQFDDLSTQKKNRYAELEQAINSEVSELGLNGLGLFQGVTYWTTHLKKEKEKLYSQFFGSSGEYNKRAMNFLKEL